MKAPHWIALVAALGFAAWAGVDLLAEERAQGVHASPPALRAAGSLQRLEGAVEWLNTGPLTAEQLRGKVVLVDFWTFTCINWHRTLPHVRAWADKYKDHGLVVVGVHSPEFGFERDGTRIRTEIARLGVPFPVAVDSRHAIWNAFGNQYWPALYFIDAEGRIRHRQFGEGEYDAAERKIQQLLAEAGARDVPSDLVRVRGEGTQADPDWTNLRTPETYLGHDRARDFATPGLLTPGRLRTYQVPDRLRLNTWALGGAWTVRGEAATAEKANGRIVHRFHARDVHLVMGPAARGAAIPFRILVDGKPPGPAHGADVDAEGRGVLAEHRLYQLVRQQGPIDDRHFEIEFLAPGAEVFAFTFG